MGRDLAAVPIGYALGSVLWGVVLGKALFGKDPRRTDNPGASGSFRQFGAAIGVIVAALDLLKPGIALYLAREVGASQWGQALTVVSTVVGHNWPVWFGFKGGGGLASVVGGMLFLAPGETLWAIAASLLAALLYKSSRIYGRLPVYPLPFGAALGLPLLIYLTVRSGNAPSAAAALLSGVAIGVRGYQMLRGPKEGSKSQ